MSLQSSFTSRACVYVPLMRSWNWKGFIVSTPGFLLGRRAQLAGQFPSVETRIGQRVVTAYVVPFDVWATLPIYVDKSEGLDIAGNLDEDILIGIPENLPESGRAAYVHSVAIELVTNVPVLAVIVEMIKLNMDITNDADRRTYILSRLHSLDALIKFAEQQRWFDGKIAAMQQAIGELRSYLN